ncbi:MAG: hypothetical protein IPH55_08505 [Betaproteobacteria bacterium]|nr:hypothetical protein [Betaproteobacteria bacterium]
MSSTSTDLRSGCGWLATAALPSRLSENASPTAAAIGEPGLGAELHVAGDELHVVAQLAELGDVARAHHAAVDALLADAPRVVHLEVERDVELVGADLQPHLVVLLPDPEQARRLLRVLDDVGERARLAGHGRRRRCRRRRRAGRARAGRCGICTRGSGFGQRCAAAGGERGGGQREQERMAGTGGRDSDHGAALDGTVTGCITTAERGAGSGRRRISASQAGASSPRNECGSAAVIVTST